jgi:hypothetical protein
MEDISVKLPDEEQTTVTVENDGNATVEVDTSVNHIALKKRWQNRRRMAWVSLISMLVVTALILFTDSVSVMKLDVLSEVITWFYFSCASVIGAYMGFTTWASKR